MDLLTHLMLQFVDAVPRLLGAIVVALAGWLIARSVSKFVQGLLKKMQLDRFTEKLNEIDIIYKSNIKLELSSMLSKTLYYLLLLIFIVAATDILGMPALSQLMQDIIAYIPNLITALAIVLIGTLLADALKSMVLSACESFGIPSGKLIASFVFYFVFLSVLMSALAQAKIDTRFITANISIVLAGAVLAFAIGYGFASKDVVANFLASFYSKDKFQVGDKISIEGITGIILEMDNTSVVLQSEGKKVIIPMSKLTTSNIELHDEISE